MCLYPTLIKNPKYTANKKNGGIIPPLTDPRVQYVPIGCQDCMECRKQKSRQWQARLQEDIQTHKNGKFITLTFSNEAYKKLTEHKTVKDLKGYQRDNQLATVATRYFLERWRKKYKKSLRHWLVTELGHNGTHNIHMHGIIWTDEPLTTVEKIWNYGFVWKGKEVRGRIINYVSAKTVNYIVKYITKKDNVHDSYKSKVLTSPGIGHNYTKTFNAKRNQYKSDDTIETYKTQSGHQINLPIYWRNKIYTDEQREKLWTTKLDKQIRWVCGEKVSIKNGEQNYYKLLAWHQYRNRKLGYGNGQKTWEQQLYEEQRRDMMNEKRLTAVRKKEVTSNSRDRD